MICNAKLGTQLLTGTMTLFETPRETPTRQTPSSTVAPWGRVARVMRLGQAGLRSGSHVGALAGRAALAVVASLAVLASVPPAAQAFSRTDPSATTLSRQRVVGLTQLPPQGQEVYRQILAGGPFRYSKDGIVFGNREARLPRKTRGYYHEYTVPTPGSRDRGARRIVCGGEIVQSPETCFYSQDHYQSFQKIDPSR
jgi:ribonuclease T1